MSTEGYLWNSGNFFFRADMMRGELQAFEPEIAAAAAQAFAKARRTSAFWALDADILQPRPENLDRLRGDGAHPARPPSFPPTLAGPTSATGRRCGNCRIATRNGNSVRGHGVVLEGHNVHVRSDDALTTVLGVSDVIVVTTDDAVLVLGAQYGDRVKQLVDELKRRKRKEARSICASIGPGAITSRSTMATAIRSSASS